MDFITNMSTKSQCHMCRYVWSTLSELLFFSISGEKIKQNDGLLL